MAAVILAAPLRTQLPAPRLRGSRCSASPRLRLRAPRRHRPRPAKPLAARKLVSGFLTSRPHLRARKTATQSLGTHQENAVFVVTIALGCVVDPDNPDVRFRQPSQYGYGVDINPEGLTFQERMQRVNDGLEELQIPVVYVYPAPPSPLLYGTRAIRVNGTLPLLGPLHLTLSPSVAWDRRGGIEAQFTVGATFAIPGASANIGYTWTDAGSVKDLRGLGGAVGGTAAYWGGGIEYNRIMGSTYDGHDIGVGLSTPGASPQGTIAYTLPIYNFTD